VKRQPRSATTLKKWRGEESPSVLRRRGCQLVPFADNVQPIAEPILIRGKEDIDAVLKAIPWQSSQSAKNTDIQRAEWHVYTRLARLNQCRLTANQAIKPQSVVWISD
jgi:hypothetical protein